MTTRASVCRGTRLEASAARLTSVQHGAGRIRDGSRSEAPSCEAPCAADAERARATGSPDRLRGRRRLDGTTSPEDGSITLLILGFALVLILAIVGITAVSEVYLTRRTLAALSDDAALAGAQSVDENSVVVGEPGSRRRLETGAVHDAVAANLRDAGAAQLDSFDWSASTADGDTVVVVEVHARSRIGIASALLGSATVPITERATAIAADNG